MLTPAFPADLPPLGELVADDPFWCYPSAAMPGEGVAHLRVWLTTGPEPGHLAVVTETGPAASVTESAGQIWAELAGRWGSSLILLEHSPAPEAGDGEETPRSGPHRRRWESPLVPRLADPGGESPSRRAGALDGRPRPPDRQQDGESVRLVPGSGRLTGSHAAWIHPPECSALLIGRFSMASSGCDIESPKISIFMLTNDILSVNTHAGPTR
jgi:hypothetical protein